MKKSLACVLGLAMCAALTVTATRSGAQIVDPSLSPTPDPVAARAAQVGEIYDLLRRRDAGELRRRYEAALAVLPSPSPTPSPSPAPTPRPAALPSPAASPAPELRLAPTPAPTVDPALTLALFALDRPAYRAAFVRNYPADPDAVNRDYGDRLDRARAVPGGSAFPVAALAGYAAGDDGAAGRALLLAAGYAGGRLRERYSAALAHVAAARPEATVLALAGLDTPARLALLSDPAWCGARPALLGLHPRDPAAAAVRDRLAETVSRCPRPKARPHRRPAPHRGAPPGARPGAKPGAR